MAATCEVLAVAREHGPKQRTPVFAGSAHTGPFRRYLA